MQLNMILKFGLFVVLLDLLKMFQNLFIQSSDIIFMATQIFTIHFLWESHKSTVFITALTQTSNGAKPCTSIVDTFAVTTNHLVC